MAVLTKQLGPLGYGAFKIGRNTGTKYDHTYDLPGAESVSTLLNGLLDMGINYIDTAPAYGVSEERIGRAIGHRRHEFVISTKVGEFFKNGRSRYDFTAEAVRRSVEESLRRLGTDYLDLVFIHSSRDDLDVVSNTDVAPVLISMRDQGWIRGIGLSGYTPEGFRATYSWADALMAVYNREDDSLAPVLAEASARGVLIIVKKGLASGRLPPDEAIRFILSNPAVTSMVIGSLSLEHMARNWRTACQMRCARPLDVANCSANVSQR